MSERNQDDEVDGNPITIQPTHRFYIIYSIDNMVSMQLKMKGSPIQLGEIVGRFIRLSTGEV